MPPPVILSFLILCIACAALWRLPLPASFKQVLPAIFMLLLLFWLMGLSGFGGWNFPWRYR